MFVKMKHWFKLFIFASAINAALFVNTNVEISTGNGMQKSIDVTNSSTMKTANSDSTINKTNVNNLTTEQSTIIKLQETSKIKEITVSTPEMRTINQEIITELNEEQTNNEIENEITTNNFDLNSETINEITSNYELFSDVTTENTQYETETIDTTTEKSYYTNTEESTTADSSERNQIDTKPNNILIQDSIINKNMEKTETTTDTTEETASTDSSEMFWFTNKQINKNLEYSTEISDSTTELPYYTTTDISDTTKKTGSNVFSKMFGLRENKKFYKNLEYFTPIAQYFESTTETSYSTTEVPYYTTTDNTEEIASTDSSEKFWFKNLEVSTSSAEYSELTTDSTSEVPYYITTDTSDTTEEIDSSDSSEQFLLKNLDVSTSSAEYSELTTDSTSEVPYYITTDISDTTEEIDSTDSSEKFLLRNLDVTTSSAEYSELTTDSTSEVPYYITTDISDTTKEIDSTDSPEKFSLKNLEVSTSSAEYSELTTDSVTEVPYYITKDISNSTEETASTEMFWFKKIKQFYKNMEFPASTSEFTEMTTNSITEVPYFINAEENTDYFEAIKQSTNDTNLLVEKEFYVNNMLTTDFPSTSTNFLLDEYSNTIEDTTLQSTTDSTTYSYKNSITKDDESAETKPVEPPSESCAGNVIITDLKVNPSNYSLFVYWSNPKPECDYKYKIQWESRFERIQSITFINTTEYLIKNLNACEEHNIIVTLVYKNEDITFSTEIATTLESIEPVENINHIYYEKEEKLSVFWKIPLRVRNCLKKYHLQIIKDNVPTDTLIIRDDNVTFIGIKDCITYTYIVAACSEKYVSPENSTTYLKTIVNSSPIFNEQQTEIYDDYVITKWNFGKIVCRPITFSVSCHSNSDKRDENGELDVIKNELTFRIDKVQPYEKYTCVGKIENEAGFSTDSDPGIFLTKSKPPTMPLNLKIEEYNNEYIYIEWDEPIKWNGIPLHYNLLIEFKKLNYKPSENCEEPGFELINKTLDSLKKEYIFMDHMIAASTYKISVVAHSDGGWSEHIYGLINLEEKSPEAPNVVLQLYSSDSVNYNTSVNVSWTEPCRMNGILNGYNIQLINNLVIIEEQNMSIEENKTWFIFTKLKPESEYIIQIFARNERFDGEIKQKPFTTPAGIPPAPSTNDVKKPSTSDVKEPWKSAAVYITEDIFNKSMGNIIYYSVIVATVDCKESRKSGIYNSNKWPQVSSDSNCPDELKPYEATDQKWNPFIKSPGKSSNIFTYILGENDSCTKNNCNKPLKSNTEYYVKIRGFTKNGFSDTDLLSFITDSDVPVGLIVGLIVGILVIAFIIAAVLFYTKGKLNFKNWPRMESTTQISPAPLPVSIKKFGPHYEKMIENPGKIKNEFQLLSTISSDVTLSTKTALLPINKKKNRYINILPYDQTRVKLIDTKENSSDYINASHIKGYSGSNEYIAAQGPTEITCPAFWQMILEQNIKIIVMLTQCVEAGKDKCYKYFPDLKEEYDLLNDIKIICVEEQTLSLYNLRTLVIKKKNINRKIIHMQFTMWPDFGVPDTVQHMINFCEVVRSAKMKKPSIILMHCSAGVGRTGTLIAVDILLQNIRDKRKVDIFGSVLNLRKQRMQMVQSERQYEFLYKCVQYMITNKTATPEIKNNLHNISESNML